MNRFIPKFIVLMVAFFIIAGTSAYFTITYFIQNEETVVVPNLVGDDILSVLELLTNLGLNAKVKDSEYSHDIPKNNIIDQDPKPGEVIKKGRDVRITISKGTKTLAMPNLKALNLQQAQLILDKNGLFKGSISYVFHNQVKKNIIISQYPLPGAEIEREISPNLLISMGLRPQEFVMPDLVGLFLDEAVLAAEKINLVIDSVKPVYLEDKPDNIVLNQEPLAGYHVLENNLINLSVNRKTPRDPAGANFGAKRNALFRYRLPPGFLKQQIRVELRTFDTTFILYDALMKPEREIWVAVPGFSVSVIFVYKNNELVKSEIFD